MIFSDVRNEARGKSRGSALLTVLVLAGFLTAMMPWADAAHAVAGGAAHGAAAEAHGAEAGPPIFGLPPIVVKVLEAGKPEAKTVVFKADLVFDEVDDKRINDTMSITKSLLPRIMDSVITGIQGKRFADVTDLAFLNDVVLQRSNDVLKPYGVVVTSLRLKDLRRP